MGRKGWGGAPPADDEEARKRIVDAAIRSMERRGPQGTSLSTIASDLGITRPTVYRYFATIDELVTAASDVALGGWTARIADSRRASTTRWTCSSRRWPTSSSASPKNHC
ncbi:TetR/AcrR family transcriptional regulator [Mycobacterium timonense]|uniref:HTH tetR-type domain-containing protein n=1 Tax=Mycobacterium timonense TaxID=701043 RepID=A0A7I9ZEA6_9MYCO|nr:TetR/AcrR family transcriptional regulator [Mycobacterium timonense]GFG99344.1 hypothetical protein MTIM_52230 [Mycobacterium timonense]